MTLAIRAGNQVVVVQQRRLAHLPQAVAGSQLESDAAIDVNSTPCRHIPAADAIVRQPKMDQLARPALEASRHGSAAGNQQFVAGHGQRPLRRHSGEGIGMVRLKTIRRTVAVVGPDQLASLGIERMDEDPHERPDARREIDRAVGDHRSAPR
ncbi:MAG: hypothetical protein FD125_3095, partial [bacterium]